MGDSQSASHYSGIGYYGHPDQYAQPQQAQNSAPQIRNPFTAPAALNSYAGQNAGYDPEYEAQVAQWQATYAPATEQLDKTKRGNANFAPLGNRGDAASSTTGGPNALAMPSTGNATGNVPGAASGHAIATENATKTVVRKGGGQTWEDSSLLEWDPTQFRIMVGNLAGEVTDESLAKAFSAYGVSKARVVRDKRSTKSKGYGFVSFHDGEKGFKAAREMVGKYIGSHPVTIKRSTTDIKPVENKAHHGKYDKKNKNRGRQDNKNQDPLRAHTGAHIEKKPVKPPNGLKMLG